MSNEDKIEKQTDKKPENISADETKNKSGHNYILSFILLILICGLAGAGYTLWNKLQKTKIELAEVVSRGQAQTGLTSKNLASLEDAIGRLEQNQLEQSEALVSLYRDRQGSNEDWALAEVEYLLIIAMHRLLLEGDVMTALAAMEAADLRLKDLGNPGLLPVRQQLATDINQLRSVKSADITGMAIYLADMIVLSTDLPLYSGVFVHKQTLSESTSSSAGNTEAPFWKRLPGLFWQEIKSLLVIKRSGEVNQSLLLPGEEYFLYQNLRLELESARHSVLRSDPENLHASIDLVQSWMRQYFDTNDPAVVNVLETLDQMRAVELKPVLPDISSSLESVRAYIHEVATESVTDEIQVQ